MALEWEQWVGPGSRLYGVTNPLLLSVIFITVGFGSAPIIWYTFASGVVVYPIALGVGGTLFVALRAVSRRNNITQITIKHRYGKKSRHVLTSMFFLLLTVGFVLYYLHGYQRPLALHFMTYVLYLLPMLILFLCVSWKGSLFLLILAAFFHRMTIYFTSPFAFGIDSHGHYNTAIEIAAIGSLAPLHASKYYYSPFYHLIGSITSIISGLGVPDGVMFLSLTFSLTVIPSLVIFVIVRSVWTEWVGVLGVFLFLASDQAIGFSLQLATTQGAAIFFILTIFALISYMGSDDHRFAVIFFVVLFGIFFTHQASLFIIVLVGGGYLLLSVIHLGFTRKVWHLTVSLGAVMFFNWIYSQSGGPEGEGDFLRGLLSSAIRNFLVHSAEGVRGTTFPGDPALTPTGWFSSLSLIHFAGGAILFSFAITGILLWLLFIPKPKYRNLAFALGGASGILFALVTGGPLIGFSHFVPSRWFLHMSMLFAIFAAPAVAYLYRSVNFSTHGTPIIVIFIICLTGPYLVIMGGNAHGSIDGPLWGSPGADRLSFTESEAATIEFATLYPSSDAVVSADTRTRSPVGRYFDATLGRSAEIWMIFDTNEIRHPPGPRQDEMVLLSRSYLESGHTSYRVWYEGTSTRVYGPNPLSEDNTKRFALIYQAEGDNCGEVRCGLYYSEI